MELTEFLLQLPIDKAQYCYWVEEVSYGMVETIFTWKKCGVSNEDIVNECSQWRMELPQLVRKEHPMLNAIQIETTCALINDCIENEYYLDCLFASLQRAFAREIGVELITEKFNLQLTGAQLN